MRIPGQTAVKAAKLYLLNSGLAMLADMQIPKPLLSLFRKIFYAHISQPPLGQALAQSRTGERGKK